MRVVVTGVGAVSAAGVGLDALRACLGDGVPRLGPWEDLPGGGGAAPGARGRIDRAEELGLEAATEAARMARLEEVAPARRGLVLGTTCGGVLALEALALAQATGGDGADLLPHLPHHAATRRVARALDVRGPVTTLSVACASGVQVLGVGADLLREGQADAVLVGGVDTVSRFILAGFGALKALGKLPYHAFGADASGVVLGEGAAALVLEPLDRAQARGATVWAEVLGHGSSNDAFAIARPDPDGVGLESSIRRALASAGLEPGDLDHVNLHGTGTRANDHAEAEALARVLGPRQADVPKSAVKPLLGHTSGAAGALEAVALTLAVAEGWVSGCPDAGAGGLPGLVRGPARRVDVSVGIDLAAGFGGNNAAVIIGRVGRGCPREIPPTEVWVTGAGGALPGVEAGADGGNIGCDGGQIGPGVGASLDICDLSGFIPTKESRRLDVFSAGFALAAHRALGGALPEDGFPLGVFLGSAFGCLASSWDFAAGLARGRVNPVAYQNTVPNAVLGYLAQLLGTRGPAGMFVHGAPAAGMAVAQGLSHLRAGVCGRALVGGGDHLGGLGGLLGGTSAGGAVCLLLERPEAALARGARPLARLTGWVASGEPTRLVEGLAALAPRPSRIWASAAPEGVRAALAAVGRLEMPGRPALGGALPLDLASAAWHLAARAAASGPVWVVVADEADGGLGFTLDGM